jgi:hypothetical protein
MASSADQWLWMEGTVQHGPATDLALISVFQRQISLRDQLATISGPPKCRVFLNRYAKAIEVMWVFVSFSSLSLVMTRDYPACVFRFLPGQCGMLEWTSG